MTSRECQSHRLHFGAVLFLIVMLTPSVVWGQTLSGVVRDEKSREPIPAATVSLLTTTGVALTRVMSDSLGRFRLQPPSPGVYQLHVEQIGYGATAPQEFRIGSEGITQVEVLLSLEPVALEAVVVQAQSRIERERIARGTPLRILTRPDIEELERHAGARAVRDLARRFPGVRVYQTIKGGQPATCVESSQRIQHTAGCDMVLVVLDGQIVDDGEFLVRHLPAQDVESIELLKPTEGGIRYGTLGGNGVLLVNTRGNDEWTAQRPQADMVPTGPFRLFFAGAVSGVGGLVAGALAACGVFECPFGSPSRNTVGLELATVAVSIPFGTHLANRRKGSFIAGLFASVGIGAVGYAVWNSTENDAAFLVTPGVQLLGAIIAEKVTQ